ncbi:hypothetical protein HanPI659440_Chr09g0320631 [Helianthus annuus]|nr:hypothetical protein HanPI659440_Chr09g0320631 [Helianthus annuus]
MLQQFEIKNKLESQNCPLCAHVKEYLDLLEDVCNKDDHFLGSPCDDNFWPKFAWELSQRRRNPVSDMQKFDKWKLGKHLEILEKIFGEHGYKFAFVPETPPSSSSIKRAYHVGGTSFYTAHGSSLSPREDVAIQQILDDMVNTDQLNIVDLNFAQDWLSQCDWAAGAFRRAGDPDSRKKMIRNAREEIGDVWVDKRLKRA